MKTKKKRSKKSPKISRIKTKSRKYQNHYLDLDKISANSAINSLDNAQTGIQSIAKYLHDNNATFVKIAEANRVIFEAIRQPAIDFTEAFKQMNYFQEQLRKHFALIHDITRSTILNSGITQMTNALKTIQIEAFAGLVIKSDFQERINASFNGITNTTIVKDTHLVSGGQMKVGFERTSSTKLSTQIIYTKFDRIDTKLQFINEDLSSTKADIAIIKEFMNKHQNLIYVLENNPFPYFRINDIKFIKSGSQFQINNDIFIEIPSGSNMDYLCQVLFSGVKENLTDEWFIDDIKEQVAIILGAEEADRITWKKLQGTVLDVNIKIATKITIEDVILTPRTEIVQLNSKYFK